MLDLLKTFANSLKPEQDRQICVQTGWYSESVTERTYGKKSQQSLKIYQHAKSNMLAPNSLISNKKDACTVKPV